MTKNFGKFFCTEKNDRGEFPRLFSRKVIVFFAHACYNVDMRTRRFAGTLLAAALAAGCAFGAAALAAPLAADALPAATPTPLTKENSVLFLPENYEQYLALKNPSDVALSSSHIAIADGDILYVYDRAEKSYSKTEITEGEEGTITKIGFADEKLFVAVSASSNAFYEYDFSGKTLNKLEINCSTFCISDDVLYTASIGVGETTIASYNISDLTSGSPTSHNLGKLDENTTPSMTLLNGTLYCTVNEHVYHNSLGENEQFTKDRFYLSQNASDNRNVKSTCAHENAFYYTAEDGLYRADFSSTGDGAGKATCVLAGEKFGALTSYGGSLYCIREKSVLRFNPDGTDYKIADYEISSASASVGRLSDAKDVARAGSLVVIADAGNRRVTVYDGKTGQYSVLAPEEADFSPSLVATDGSVIAAVSNNKVYVCNDIGTLAFEDPVPVENIKGIACVYGSVYYVTQNDIQGKIGGGHATKTNGTPTFMTSDLYGNLYVAYNSGSVRSFTEEQFITQSAAGETLDGVSVPLNARSLRADFNGNLYYLDENGKLCNTDSELATVNGAEFVYRSEETATPSSFALGYEDDEVYFLFGDYIVKSEAGALKFPTLSTIGADGVSERVFAAQDEARLCDVSAGSVGIRVELGDLTETAEYFSYLGYRRTAETLRGVVLDEITTAARDYRLVALYRGNGVYEVELFPADRCTDVSPRTGDGGYWQETEGRMYLVSNAAAYYFPCLVQSLSATEGKLPRGAAVNVLAIVRGRADGGALGIGYDYAYVEYGTNARATARGYVPLSVLSEVSPFPPENEEYFFGYLKASEEGVSFESGSGETLVLTERTFMRFYRNEDGSYTARYAAEDGSAYFARVDAEMIESGESDAWRYALIIGLSVLALVIIAAYVFLLPWGKKNKKRH